MKSSPPVIAALVDDAIAQGEREAKASLGKIHSTLPPLGAPLDTVPPGLAHNLELPGAELFATPGLPSVKPADVATRFAGQVNPGAAAPATTQRNPVASEPALGEFPEGFSALQSLEPDEPAAERPSKKAPRLWIAVVSLIGIAFVLGIGLRGRGKATNAVTAIATATTATQSSIGATASASAEVTAQASALLVATASQPAMDPIPDASVRELADAGVVRKPPAARAPQTAPRARRRTTTAPRYNSKVSRSRGKTTR
jgi:hypothetical protein